MERKARRPNAAVPARDQGFLSPRGTRIFLGLAILLGLSTAVLGGILTVFVQSPPHETPAPATTPFPALGETAVLGRPGPWGVLQRYEIDLAPPEDFFTAADCPNLVDPWVFRGYTRESLLELFVRATVDRPLTDALLAGGTCDATGCTLRPTLEQLAALDRTDRTTIYPVLARFPENPNYFYAFRRKSGEIDDWLKHSDLSPKGKEIVRGLLYPGGPYLMFANFALACSKMDSEDKVHFLRSLGRTKSLLVKLRIPEGTSTAPLADYWDRGRRSKDIRPLLESVAEAPGLATLDIIHLLPRFARARLYSFPDPTGPDYDCHWTSLNFLRKDPDDRFLDSLEVAKEFNTRWQMIPMDQLRLGDVIAFYVEGSTVHTVVYIADDIVMTKNGRKFWRPWVLMSLDRVIDYYRSVEGLELKAFRQAN